MSLEDDALRFDKTTFEAACALAKSAPFYLTEFHFDQLAIVSPRLEADAREAVRQAQLAIVRAREPAPLVTKSAEPAKPKRRSTLTKADLEVLADGMAIGLKPVLENYKTKLATLEQRITEQGGRILELEAQRAATSKVGV